MGYKMAFEAIGEERKKEPLHVHLFGLSGSGKSYAASRMTAGMKRAIIDYEGGFRYLCKSGDLYMRASKSTDLRDGIKEALKANVDAIVVDGVTTFMQSMMSESLQSSLERLRKKDKEADLSDVRVEAASWNVWKSEIENICSVLLSSGKNVVLIQRGKTEKIGFKETSTIVVDGTDIPMFLMDTSIICYRSPEGDYRQSIRKERKLLDSK
jgi:hypothetical protein